MTVVSRLRLERLRRGLTLEEVYLRTRRRLHPSRLSRLERGISCLTMQDIELLGVALEIPVGEIAALSVPSRSGR